ncbi:MAG TPA: tetratricopeptide repeat protein, partial [Longimicrobiales bacterium]|nr:tetratricopeptide repeat protein [Longimicrobiales bacterium]
ALQWYGEHAVKMGRADEAERLLRRAVELDPLSVIAHNNLGLVLWLGGRIPEARARFEHTTRIDPGFVIAYLLLFRVHTAAGDLGGALEAGRTWAALSGQADPADVDVLVSATLGSAPRPDAVAVLDRWDRSPPRMVDVVMFAGLLGEKDRALTALERAFDARNPLLTSIRTGFWTAGLRAEPRYQRLVARMGFPALD